MASEKKNRIGVKGLETIFGDGINDLITNIENSPEVQQSLAQEVPINKIIANPHQPRKHFNTQELEELSQSIKLHGLIQPIIVSKISNSNFYQLIAGERRKKAAEMIGLKTIKAVTIDATDQQMMEFALIENIQRVDLNAFEEAQAYKTLIDKMKWTHEELAKKINKSRPHITNTLRILDLPAEVLKMVKDNKLTMGHVRPLLQLTPNSNLIVALAHRAFKEKWSVRKVEDMVRVQQLLGTKKSPNIKDSDIYLIELENSLSKKLSAKVKIKNQKLIISYLNDKDLNRLLELLKLID
ncbi:ParB/RepB/Spo0J family partition protein [Spiroplasma platyhelix]|uniref:ParB/RepB/Spo0J family partition protein n=1 Tax=Spiroplasma platyhelix PALS-1 TaxID=1276218 RepID=A0A846UDP4_9MOLU|nr:ParB/RepB/Spo0J family partition protein [Spiroplasma platyhelix]MBE4704245.1 Stage 0 sporulation protein J [Spiroplasma platyhelix PALS-1]NKE38618.1 ParB/RepB/Spo0J family partition protein [Spiroplasma platyhelix PALS-1]UJB28829.1 site-specific DNA-binding protein [Spiroplasma platyhelix PALS-1]